MPLVPDLLHAAQAARRLEEVTAYVAVDSLLSGSSLAPDLAAQSRAARYEFLHLLDAETTRLIGPRR